MALTEVLNRELAAKILGVNEKTIRRWIQDGVLRTTRDGRERLISVDDLYDCVYCFSSSESKKAKYTSAIKIAYPNKQF